MKANYHAHTYRCQHAAGTEEDYVLAAIQGGFQVLGFSDHAPWPYRSGFVSGMRMTPGELPGYMRAIKELKSKYQDQITLHVGLECEYYKEYEGWLQELSQRLDYLILGAHFTGPDDVNPYVGSTCHTDKGLFAYVDNCVAAMETGKYAYLAHPDLFIRGRGGIWDRSLEKAADQLVSRAKELSIPLEYNLHGDLIQKASGQPGYPCRAFWEYAASYGAQAILGVDAHDPMILKNTDEWNEAKSTLLSLGWRIADRLPMDKNA